jgi:hypothetical protein
MEFAPPPLSFHAPARSAVRRVAWLESPSVVLLVESGGHWDSLKTLLVAGRIAGPRVHEARVAAPCRQHGVRELRSADRDFGRFPGLAVSNPLVGG